MHVSVRLIGNIVYNPPSLIHSVNDRFVTIVRDGKYGRGVGEDFGLKSSRMCLTSAPRLRLKSFFIAIDIHLSLLPYRPFILFQSRRPSYPVSLKLAVQSYV